MLAVFFLLLIVAQVLAQNGFKPSITCYIKYDHEETKSQSLNTLLGYAYHHREVTHYATNEHELCSKVSCACFSYRSVCSSSSPGSNHYSQCTDEDRQNGVIKWHHGWASHDQCEDMRRHPQTYLDLTCCYTDRCNNQPGKITKVVDSEIPVQHQQYINQQPYHQEHIHYQHHYITTSQETSTTSQTTTTYRHRSHAHRPTTTTRAPEPFKPSPVNDKGLQPLNSLSLNSYSIWMIIVTLTVSLLTMRV